MRKKKIDILITGIARYIGTHVLLNLHEDTKLTVLVIDDLSLGSSKIIKDLEKNFKLYYFMYFFLNWYTEMYKKF